jgi:DNA-binding IclR family transcriptional regulator
VGESSRVPAAERTLAVLRALAAQPRPVPAAALARELELPRSTTYHLLAVLESAGFVTHLPEERRYAVGVAAFEIGSAYLRHDGLERLARPLLAALTRETGHTIHLGILDGREVLYLVKEQPPAPDPLVTEVGVRLPAHLTASGRSLLARLPEAQVTATFPRAASLSDRTGRGPRRVGELRGLLRRERMRGWSSEDGEVTVGFASVAAAAFDHGGRPAAAIGATFRREARPEEAWPGLAERLRDAAAELTRRLGG